MKELIIIVYKINVAGHTRASAEQVISNLFTEYNLSKDEELKENYIIREIWLPVEHQSDVQVIYPVPRYTAEINDLIQEISNKIGEDPTNTLSKYWNNIVRELKIRKLGNE